MPKLNLDLADDLFATPAPPPGPVALAAYDPPTPCLVCKAATTTAYTNPAVPLCTACATDPKPRLDAAEREVLRLETQLAAWDAWFEGQKAKATDQACARYANLQEQVRLSIGDPARHAELMAGVETAIQRGGPLGELLAAMRRYDQAAIKIGKYLDHLSRVQSALLRCRAAHGWTVPDDVADARLRLGQPGIERPDDIARAVTQLRLAAA